MNFLSPRFNGSLIIKMYEHISVRRLICQHHKMDGKARKILYTRKRWKGSKKNALAANPNVYNRQTTTINDYQTTCEITL